MDVVETRVACRALLDAARATGRTVGLVPTMGALHEGHISLMTRARAECDLVAASIFVNPLQFGDPEDIANYPRTLERDLAVCAEAGVDVVFVPSVAEMYPSWPEPPATTVSVVGVSESWEGASRPGHFDGVATVVAKLFAIAGPCRAYFGLKDFQQLAVVRRMAADLSAPIDVVGCPIVRERDGLALSSRNVRLSAPERTAATVLARALAAGRAAVASGERSAAALHRVMAEVVATEPLVRLDYAAAVDAASLRQHETVGDPAATRLLIAAGVGPVRLIDNSAALVAADAAETPATRTLTAAAPHTRGVVTPRQLERIG
jgi:pantoate--beta-alanine ligase